MAITVTIPTITTYSGTIPDKATQTPVEFADNVYLFHLFYNDSFITDTTAMASAVNTFKTEANALAVEINANALIAQSASNYQGDYNAGTTYSTGQSVTYSGSQYSSKISGNIGNTPDVSTTQWLLITAISDLVNPSITGLIKEQVSISTLTLGATSSVQTYTATGNFTIVDDLESGESVVFQLINGGWVVTYPTILWVGGAEPTLTTEDTIVFYKIGTTLYGAYVGSVVA